MLLKRKKKKENQKEQRRKRKNKKNMVCFRKLNMSGASAGLRIEGPAGPVDF